MQKVKDFLFANSAAIVVLLAFVAQSLGWITPEQAKKYEHPVPVSGETERPAALVSADSPSLTPEQIVELIQKAIAEAMRQMKPPEPTPVPDVIPGPAPAPVPRPIPNPSPEPVQTARIRLCDETGSELKETELEAGKLFRVSAVGVGESIGWHPVESGDVRLSASTDGREYAGYLTSGQWVEFSLTDFASKSQASLRVTCLTAPQPPPGPEPDDGRKPGPIPPSPGPGPQVKNVQLFVIHNVNKITPDTAIVLNATQVWDSFTAQGNDWKFVEIDTRDEDERKLIAQAGNITLPSLVICDKSTGRQLTVEPLPKSVIALEALVAKYTEGK